MRAVLICLVLFSSVSFAEPIPANVAAAERTIATWLNSLKGKSVAAVEKELGAPSERSTWEFRGKAYPALRYKTAGATVDMRFFNEKVLVANFHLLTE